ncbi:MAG: exonuclease SbcCD subunit D [Ignavibacteriaceae bacterium]|nr:exonuclease SbcCD subunit D [Ignavibacteriaceae bacterium]
MKILHTADWHLGKKLYNKSRHEEQVQVLEEIISITEENNIDVVVVAGDIFDNANPSADSQSLFYKTVKRLAADGKRPVIIIAGNHDSPEKIEAPHPLAKECGIIMAGFPDSKASISSYGGNFEILRSGEGFFELKIENVAYNLRVILTPYPNELTLKRIFTAQNLEQEIKLNLNEMWGNQISNFDENGVNIMVAHLFCSDLNGVEPVEGDDEKSVRLGPAGVIESSLLPDGLHYAALGHIHKLMRIEGKGYPVYYSGSPLNYSLREERRDNFVLIVEANPGMVTKVDKVKLNSGKKIYRKTFTSLEEAEEWLLANQDIWVELNLKLTRPLTSDESNRLSKIHEGIITLNLEIISELLEAQVSVIDVTKSPIELFESFYTSEREGRLPSEELKKLFSEILDREEEL